MEDILIDSKLRPADAKNFETDQVLRENGLFPFTGEVAKFASSILAEELCVPPDEVEALVSAGKYLRNSFVHRGGEPQEDLQRLIARDVFSEKLIRWEAGKTLEVTLPMAGRIHAFLIARATLIQHRAITRWPNLWQQRGKA